MGRIKIKIDKLDRLWGRVIKARDNFTCQRCGGFYPQGGKGIQAAHVISRRHANTRHDILNGICLDTGCHLHFHAHPFEFVEFVKKWLGEHKYEELRKKSLSTKKPDREAILAELQAALEKYE